MMNKRNIAIFVGMAIAGAIAGSTLGVPSGVSAQSHAISVGMANVERMQHEGKNGHGKNMEEVAAILKLTKEELRTQVRSGKTLAQIATTQKVDIKLVIDSIVTNIKTYIAEELSSGEITQAQADKKLANVTTKVTEMVNNLPPARGERGSKTRSENYDESTETQKTGA
jgi:hypothetical protein